MSEEVENRAPDGVADQSNFLVVGEGPFRDRQRRSFGHAELSMEEAEGTDAVLEILKSAEIDGAVVELNVASSASLEVIEMLRRLRPGLPVVVASPYPSVAEAVRIMQLGVDSYVASPVGAIDVASKGTADVLEAVMQIVRRRRAPVPYHRAENLRASLGQSLVAESEAMKTLLRNVALVAPAKTTVLILGETGSGKDRIAQSVHQSSPRRKRPFVAVNCSALSETLLESELFGHERGAFTGAHGRHEGRFKAADGGTLFLDEIGELSPALQVKLLRVLQERQFERVGGSQPLSVNVRVIAATNRDLALMVREGAFRPDLFYRLNVMVLEVPPLRRRPGDLEPLVAHILGRLSLEFGVPAPELSREILDGLARHDWPGNVRELENVLERLMIVSRGRRPTWGDLPAELREPAAWRSPAAGSITGVIPERAEDEPAIPGATFRELERYAILRTYESCGRSPSRTAEILGLSLRTVHYRLREYRGAPGRRKAPLGSVPPSDDDDSR